MTNGAVVAGTHLAHVLWLDGLVVCWIDRQGFSKLKGTIYLFLGCHFHVVTQSTTYNGV